MEDYTEPDEIKKSKINSAGLINLTLKDLWESFYRHLRVLDYSKANADLDCLWVEFGGDEKEDTTDGKKVIKDFEAIEKEVGENFSKIPLINGFKKYSPEDLKVLGKQYKLLIKKALFLKRLQNNQGKGTAYDDNSSDYMNE